MNWAKVSTGLHRNPKIRMAGRDAREVYLLMLLVNAELDADGELPWHYAQPEYVADALQCSHEEAAEGLKRCETFHLLQVGHTKRGETIDHAQPGVADTGATVTILGWDEEWRVKTSSDRVRKYREKNKGTPEGNVTETLPERMKRPRGEERRGDKKRVSTATQIPSDWCPDPKHQVLALELGLNLPLEVEKFRDHFTANGKRFKDWGAAFRNWLRRSSEYSRGKPGAAPRHAPSKDPRSNAEYWES